MRDYGKLFCKFWTSETIQALSDDAKMLAAYLLTNEHCTLIGCYRLTNGYVSDDLVWAIERVAKGFVELSEKGFATRCERTNFVLIHKYLEWNPLENPNQRTAARRMFEKTPDSVSVKGALAELLEITDWQPLQNPSATVPQPVAVTVEGAVAGTVSVAGAVFSAPEKPGARQKKSGGEEGRSTPIYRAYATAYFQRYGVDPQRNAKVNKLLCNFLDRVSADEAEHIAAFYVHSNRGLYVSSKHAVDLLLRDAEGLRTEWATNRTVTDTEARQADQSQARGNVFNKLISEVEAAHGD